MLPVKEFGVVYRRMLSDLLDRRASTIEFNDRTQTNVAVLDGGQSFQLSLRDDNLPTCGLRKLHPRTAAAEVSWFLLGSKDVGWLRERDVKIWDPFADDNIVENAYGYRWRNHFGRDQIDKAVKALREDRSNRQVYISAWDPAKDGLGNKAKNIPCPVGFTFHIAKDELHSTLLLRSSDVFVGLPYDVMGHAMLMAIMANWIDERLTLGTMTVTLAHAHMYDAHWSMAEEALTRRNIVKTDIPLQVISADRPDWDLFINNYAQAAERAEWPAFNPRPRLIP